MVTKKPAEHGHGDHERQQRRKPGQPGREEQRHAAASGRGLDFGPSRYESGSRGWTGASGSVPGEPIDQHGRARSHRVVLADDEALDPARWMHAQADEVPEPRVAEHGEALVMLEPGQRE